MRRRKAYDGFSPAVSKGSRIPADAGVPGTNSGGEMLELNDSMEGKSAAADEKDREGTVESTNDEISLHYGNLCLWRAMAPAIVLHLGGVDFKFVRYEQYFGEAMRRAAKAAGSGKAPWLVVNGRVLTQTGAIARFCSDIAGFTPKDPFDAAKVDEVIQCITDFYEEWTRVTAEGFKLNNGSRKQQQKIPSLLEKLREDIGPFFFNYMNKLLKENGAEDHAFLVGNKLTVADIALWRMVGSLSDDACTTSPIKYWPVDMTHRRWPLVYSHVKRIDAHPLIRAYMLRLWPPGFAVSPFPGRFPNPVDGKWQNMGTSLEPPDINYVKFWASRGVVDPDVAVEFTDGEHR